MSHDSGIKFCFICGQEMQCIKTGFHVRFPWMRKGFVCATDLFQCTRCGALAHNQIMAEYQSDREPNWEPGEEITGVKFKHDLPKITAVPPKADKA